jgi:hypothetical protein
MAIYLILHKVPQQPDQPSIFEEVAMSLIQPKRTSQKIDLLKSVVPSKGNISILENTKWGVILVSSDLTSEEIFNEIKSHVSTYSDFNEIELLVFGITEWVGVAASNTTDALHSIISDLDGNDDNSLNEISSPAENGKAAENLKSVSFRIVRCRHCNSPAMYGGDVCYSCNSK